VLFVERFLFGFSFFLVEIRSARQSVCIRASVRLFVLRFHQSRGQCAQFFFTQAGCAVALWFLMSFCMMLFHRGGSRFRAFRCVFCCRTRRSGRFRFAFVIRQHPVRQTSRKPPWSSACRLGAKRRTRRRLLEIGLAFFGLLFPHRLDRGLLWTPAVLRQRLARQNNVIFPRFDRCRGTRATIA